MRTARPFLRLLLLAVAPALASCGRSPTQQLPEDRLTFIAATSDAPPLVALQATFWAKLGETRHVAIPYVAVNGYTDECLDFIVPANALWKRPDGTRFQSGDSVLVTVKVVDPRLFNFQFEPKGLQFDPSHPAEIRVSYKWANLAGIDVFGFWRQENPGDPWVKVGTTHDTNTEEIRAAVRGFTKYAMATE